MNILPLTACTANEGLVRIQCKHLFGISIFLFCARELSAQSPQEPNIGLQQFPAPFPCSIKSNWSSCLLTVLQSHWILAHSLFSSADCESILKKYFFWCCFYIQIIGLIQYKKASQENKGSYFCFYKFYLYPVKQGFSQLSLISYLFFRDLLWRESKCYPGWFGK